jgi:predicted GTPase
VVSGTPVDLGRLLDVGHPLRQATYELRELGRPDLADVLTDVVVAARAAGS